MAHKKTSSVTKRSKKRPPKKKAAQRFGFFSKALLSVLIISAFGLLFLDIHIRAQFEGKRWALPAKVYARPLELYAGYR